MLQAIINELKDGSKQLYNIEEDAILKAAALPPIEGADDFQRLINSLINQHVTLSAEHIEEAKLKEIQRIDYLRSIHPDIDKLIYDAAPDIQRYTAQFYEAGKTAGFKELSVNSFTGTADINALFHLSHYNFDLIRNLNNDLKAGIRREVWQGVARDRSPVQIADRIKKLPLEPVQAGRRMITPENRAKLIAHTESTRARHQGLYMTYKEYDVGYYDLVNTPWKNLCTKCIAAEGDNPYRIDDLRGWPPLHVLCHCTTMAADEPAGEAKDPDEYLNFVSGKVEKVNKDLVLTF